MDHTIHNTIANFIWNIADDVLRDVYVRGKETEMADEDESEAVDSGEGDEE